MEDKAVTLFRQFITVKTVQPNPDYGKNNSRLFVQISSFFGGC